MKDKFLIALICFGATAGTVSAQSGDDHSMRKLYLDFGGSIGVFIPVDNAADQRASYGSNAMTSLQLNYRQNYFIKLQFGQTTVDFKSQNLFGGITSRVNTKANSTNLGLAVGYQRSFGPWQPFVLAGAGVSFMDVPATSFDSNTNIVNYSTLSGTYLYVNAGGGINFKISKSFTVFLEGQGSTIPNIPKNSNTHLSGISALLGIKAPL